MISASNVEKIIKDLGSNYHDDLTVLNNIYSEIASIASNISNLTPTDAKLYPYIKKAVKAEYLARGAEGLRSRSEGSISSTYEDIIDRLKTDIVQAGLRRVY